MECDLLAASLETNILIVGHDDLFIIVDLELSIDGLGNKFLDTVLSQITALDVLEAPGYQVISSCSDNAFLLTLLSEVIESCWLEVYILDLVLGHILWGDLELFWVGLLFTHAMLEASLTIVAHRWNDQKVGRCGGQDPLAVTRDFDTGYGVLQTREQSPCILADFVVKSDSSIKRADCKLAIRSRSDSIELDITLVDTLSRDLGL